MTESVRRWPRYFDCVAAIVGALIFASTGWGQTSSTSDSPAFGGTMMSDSAPEQSGLRPARRAPANASWMNQATPPYGSSYQPPQSATVIAPKPYTPQPYDAVYLDGLEHPAPPEIRVAGLAEDTVAPLNQMSPEPQGQLPPGARDGVFQKIYFTGTWLPRVEDEADTLGFGELETGVVFGFP
ncbi:MAG: hypothetical protein H0T51_06740, partial [Pirellulales bacterium]|nr:hypothetical protein [Pirellulales bacterium]